MPKSKWQWLTQKGGGEDGGGGESEGDGDEGDDGLAVDLVVVAMRRWCWEPSPSLCS